MKNLSLLVVLIALYSCQKNQSLESTFDNVKDAKLISALKSSYNLSSFNIKATEEQENIIKEALIADPKYKNIFPKLNVSSLRLFENKDEGIIIAIFNFENTSEKLFSIKGYVLQNKFIITNDFLFGRKLENKNNGQIIITNNNDAMLINVENGVQSFRPIQKQAAVFKAFQMNDCAGNHGGTGFCQRQAGERFSDCYKSEKDEFCDGFWSCLAVDTQPQVMLLIAAACSCGATPCA